MRSARFPCTTSRLGRTSAPWGRENGLWRRIVSAWEKTPGTRTLLGRKGEKHRSSYLRKRRGMYRLRAMNFSQAETLCRKSRENGSAWAGILPSRDVVQKKQGERLRIGRVSPKPRRCARKRVEWLLAGRASPKPGRCAQGWPARRRALARLVERTDFAGQASPPGFPPPCHRFGLRWGRGCPGAPCQKKRDARLSRTPLSEKALYRPA